MSKTPTILDIDEVFEDFTLDLVDDLFDFAKANTKTSDQSQGTQTQTGGSEKPTVFEAKEQNFHGAPHPPAGE